MPRCVKEGIVVQAVKRIEDRMMVLVSKIPLRIPDVTVNVIRDYVGSWGVSAYQKIVRDRGVGWQLEGRMGGCKNEGVAFRKVLLGIPVKVVTNPIAILNLTWNPWFDTDWGKTVLGVFKAEVKETIDFEVTIRWVMSSRKSSSVSMWKVALPSLFRRTRGKPLVADEDYRGVVETGV